MRLPHILPVMIIKRPLGSEMTWDTEKGTDLWISMAAPLALLEKEE